MKFSLEKSSGFIIHGYREGEVSLRIPAGHADAQVDSAITRDENGLARIHSSFILTHSTLHTDWPPQQLEQLKQVHLEPLIKLAPELVLLGTGATHRFPAPELIVYMNNAGIGLEVMDTQAACRTFNILSAEGRGVAAALII